MEIEPLDITVETFNLGGRPVTEHFKEIREDLEFAVGRLMEFHVGGFQIFTNTMQFDSSVPTKGEDSGLGKILEQVAVKVLDGVLGKLPGGAVLQLLREVFSLATAAPAPTSGGLGAYTMHEMQRIGQYYNSVTQNLKTEFVPRMATIFMGLEGDAPAPGDVALTGDHAAFMKFAVQHAEDLRLANLSMEEYQDQSTLAWLRNSKEGGAGTTGRGLKDLANGTIRIEIDADEDDGTWMFEVEDALLYASARSGQAADLVRNAIGSGRKSLWDCGLPVFVVFNGPGVASGTTKYDVQVAAPGRVVGSLGLAPAAVPLWKALVANGSTWQEIELKVKTALRGG